MLTKNFYISTIAKSASLFIVALGAFWVILEPYEGISFFLPPGEHKEYTFRIYVLILVTAFSISLLVSVTAAGYNYVQTRSGDTWGSSRADFDHLSFLKSAEEKVILVGLSLAPFSTEEYINCIERLIESDVDVKILLVNPLTPNLCQRPKDLYKVNTDLGAAVTNTLRVLLRLRESLGKRRKRLLNIRLINTIPHYGLFSVDQKVLWNPYISTATGLDSPFLISDTRTSIGKRLIDDFTVLWKENCFEVTESTTINDLKAFLMQDLTIYDSYPDKQITSTVETLLSI